MRKDREVIKEITEKGYPFYHQIARTVHRSRKQPDISKNSLGASPAQRALAWIATQELPTGGIKAHSESQLAYPEITGYMIPTLMNYDNSELASRLINWLLQVQQKDGSYTDPQGTPYIFDTGQALRGLLCGSKTIPSTLQAAEKAADYLYGQMKDGGKRGFGERYNENAWIPESIQLYVLPPFFRFAELFENEKYYKAAEYCQEFYIKHKDTLHIDTLTHFLAYELEALIDLGFPELATPILGHLEDKQNRDGSVAGFPNKKWVCTPGLAQLSICWYKVKNKQPADNAMKWLEAHQQFSGGFLGSYGWLASYFPDVELPWAAKFYLDANKTAKDYRI